ncbi:MauE/DoxX family redox-associated membrane protein [Kordiimonas pumila]|uniref:Methylamine utilization protein MauE n=1 Tax=Kordiimonas pumila TaxID=2161677 RepID=A0ABV7D5A1_9PROT|nr:MauE/DoxX family redox-associated membrane protein [Kordiimonas pumila]
MDLVLVISAKLFLAAVLAIGALKKLNSLGTFETALKGFSLIPNALSRPLAYGVPFSEAAIAIALLVPVISYSAALAALGLMVLYAALMMVALTQSSNPFDCGCNWGKAKTSAHPFMLIRNGILLVAALVAAAPQTTRALGWFDGMNIFFSVAALLALYATLEALLALPSFQHRRHS